jgi:hypothetical protein
LCIDDDDDDDAEEDVTAAVVSGGGGGGGDAASSIADGAEIDGERRNERRGFARLLRPRHPADFDN